MLTPANSVPAAKSLTLLRCVTPLAGKNSVSPATGALFPCQFSALVQFKSSPPPSQMRLAKRIRPSSGSVMKPQACRMDFNDLDWPFVRMTVLQFREQQARFMEENLSRRSNHAALNRAGWLEMSPWLPTSASDHQLPSG